eukprot:15481985-Alexandrium_andersonii.AAC.1
MDLKPPEAKLAHWKAVVFSSMGMTFGARAGELQGLLDAGDIEEYWELWSRCVETAVLAAGKCVGA